MTIAEKLQGCIDTLNEIKDGGYWPFASPAPSSTEVKLKGAINSGIFNLESALALHQSIFGHGRNCMEAPSVSIVRIK